MTRPLQLRSPARIVQDYLMKVQARIPVSRAYIFGSTARGERGAASDLDLIVVSRGFTGLSLPDRLALLSKDWRYRLMPDLHALTPNEFRARLRDSLIFREIMKTAERCV